MKIKALKKMPLFQVIRSYFMEKFYILLGQIQYARKFWAMVMNTIYWGA